MDGGRSFSWPSPLHSECDFYFYSGGSEVLSDGTVLHAAAGESVREGPELSADGGCADYARYGGLQRVLRSEDDGARRVSSLCAALRCVVGLSLACLQDRQFVGRGDVVRLHC